MVKQNIVFVENTPGSLQKVTKILAENQIDIYGFGCFDAPEFANFRMVCDNPERADEIMAEHGYMTRITQAILVDLQDEIGGLDKLLKCHGRQQRKPSLHLHLLPQRPESSGSDHAL